MPLTLRFGRRMFAPSARFTLLALALALAVAFVRLGFWQWHKWVQADAEWAAFARGAAQVQPLGSRALAEVERFQRVSVGGRLDGEHQFLLDNRSSRGRAGYEVLTPLARADGRVLLVDRGWVPFTGSRRRLPPVALTDTGEVTVSGRVADLPSAGLASGRAPPQPLDPWPKVTSFPGIDELARALGHALDARILLLDPRSPYGFVREWQPPGLTPLRYLSYAIQWWCFAVLALVLWAIMSVRTAAP
jgi:surfeit locus 1 family protein